MYTAEELTCKRARNVHCAQKKFKEPLASSRLRRLGVDETTINAIYKLPFQITRETKLSIYFSIRLFIIYYHMGICCIK